MILSLQTKQVQCFSILKFAIMNYTITKLVLLLILMLSILSCDKSYENPIDDTRIIGTWHRKNYIENGTTIAEQDSIVYHFLADGRMIVKYYSSLTASQPDDNYQFDLQNDTLRYWNSDYNVSEVKTINFISDTEFRIKMYNNYYYDLFKIY